MKLCTISAVRGYFSKLNGQLAKQTSVMVLFNEYGQFLISNQTITADQLLEELIEFDVIDIIESDQILEVLLTLNIFTS